MLSVEHHAAIDLVVSGEDRIDRCKHLFDTKVRQITQTAVIDAKHQYVFVADQPRRRDHCTVSTQHDDEVNIERLAIYRTHVTSRNRVAHLRDPASCEPCRKLYRSSARLSVVRFDHDTDRSDMAALHRPMANNWLIIK